MAAHLVIIACLVAEPHTCSEIPVPEMVYEDVVSCNGTAKEKSEAWQIDHKDYLVIATKCAKESGGGGAAPPEAAPPSGQSN
jgi:hypothetical protein